MSARGTVVASAGLPSRHSGYSRRRWIGADRDRGLPKRGPYAAVRPLNETFQCCEKAITRAGQGKSDGSTGFVTVRRKVADEHQTIPIFGEPEAKARLAALWGKQRIRDIAAQYRVHPNGKGPGDAKRSRAADRAGEPAPRADKPITIANRLHWKKPSGYGGGRSHVIR